MEYLQQFVFYTSTESHNVINIKTYELYFNDQLVLCYFYGIQPLFSHHDGEVAGLPTWVTISWPNS